MDASRFAYVLTSNNTVADVRSNLGVVKVFSESVEISSSSFALAKVGSTYTFSNPAAVENWALSFVDVADSAAVAIDLDPTGTPGASTTISMYVDDQSFASTTAQTDIVNHYDDLEEPQ